MKFFTIDQATRRVTPSAEILLINAFSVIWARSDKDRALKEIAYVVFMESLEEDNPYRDTPEEIKEATVIKELFGDEPFVPDEVVKHARETLLERYKDTNAFRYYQAAVKAGEALRNYLETVDFEERTKSNAMVHDPKKTRDTIAETIDTLNNLKKVRERVITESFEVSKQVKNRTGGLYED